MSRQQAKQQTRQRLLDAALALLDAEGEPGLTTTKVAQRAGIAQSSFYVHFADMDDLLRHLIEQLWDERRAASLTAITASRQQASTPSAVRELFRTTVTLLVAHPAVLRLVVRSRLDPSSPLGDYARTQLAVSRRNLMAGLAAGGAPQATPEERRKLEMQADGLIALVDTLALGHLEGRYPDVEEILDTLVQFSRATSARRRPTRMAR